MNLSFQEKSLWVMLASLSAAFGIYFAAVLPAKSINVLPQQIALFGGLVVLIVVAQVVGHALIAVFGRTDTDERDRLIHLKGVRNGNAVLGAGMFFTLTTAFTTQGNFIFTHVLLAFWVLSELVTIVSQLVLHRRGT